MAQETVLQIVRDVCNEIGIVAPNTAVGSTDLQVIQITALINREGKELAGRGQWTELVREQTFTSLAAEDQGVIAGGLVSTANGMKYIVNETIWDRTGKYKLSGPTGAPQWQAEKSFTTAGPYARYRIRQNHLYMLPAPAAGRSLVFEYLTENWVSNAAGTLQRAKFTMDDDFPILDSNLVTLGGIWRWKKSKGLEYAEDFQTYEFAVVDALSRTGTKPIVSLDGPSDANYQPYVVVPLTNWNQP